MSVAFLFPGQGAEEPRMGLALARRFPAARALLEQAAEATDAPLLRLLERGGAGWGRTALMQPLLVAVALGTALALGLQPTAVAGHSLGELSAWAAAGAIAPEACVELAVLRGRLMAREATRVPGGMLSVRADRDELGRALERASSHGMIVLAGCNAPQQHVVSGVEAALAALARELPCTRLPAEGAWHSPAMTGAVAELRAGLARIPQHPPRAHCAPPTDFVNPFHLDRTLAALPALGIDTVVTLGPARDLRRLVKDNLGEAVRLVATDDERAFDAALGALSA